MTPSPTVRRRNGGKDLHDALYYADLSHNGLAKRTQGVDPEGKGVSPQLIGFLLSRREWGRDTTTHRTAQLIEQALGVEPWALFEPVADE